MPSTRGSIQRFQVPFEDTKVIRLLGEFVLCCAVLCGTAWSQNCTDFGWEKINGMRPETLSYESALYTSINSDGIVVPCFDRCKSAGCTGFIVDFERSICFAVKPTSREFVPEPNITYYQQICLKVPTWCKNERLWQVERTLGAILIDSTSTWLSQRISRGECYEKCIQAGDRCKSAQFHATEALAIDNTIGTCSLSMVERGTRPQAYRASMYRDEYLQNNCRNVSTKDYCSYAEYRNMCLPYSDVMLPGLDLNECEDRCNLGADGFICKAYTVDFSKGKPNCLLHSEDTISLGVSSLVDTPNTVHKEREPCLDLQIQCGNSTLTVQLRTAEPFDGRMYASGFGDTCGIQGTKKNVTILTLPLPTKEDIDKQVVQCGLTPAFSIDNENRTHTFVWATIVVQFNPIIQRLGDQAARIGCSLDERDLPEPRNVSVQTSFTFLDQHAGLPRVTSTVVNTSSNVPMVTMRIVDEDYKDAVVTQLGQKLILKIDIQPPDAPYDIMAGHLVASSATGGSSYLLLDEVGCPTDPATFPALLKNPVDNRSLVSTFTAFKFPDSQVVRFNVNVKFCRDECMPATCRWGQISYGRRRRSTPTLSDTISTTVHPYTAEVTEIVRNNTPDELPLQLSIIVQSPVISADPLLSRESSRPDTVLLAGGKDIDGLLCVDASLALGLLMFWLIIQIVLIVGCLLAVGRYRRMAIQAEEDRADILARHLYGIHGGNFEIARRVRWADRNNSSVD